MVIPLLVNQDLTPILEALYAGPLDFTLVASDFVEKTNSLIPPHCLPTLFQTCYSDFSKK